jgi:hypothetical protein
MASKKERMTRSQADRKAKSWRITAGKLLAELSRDRIDADTRDHLKAAHDQLCEAFRALERDYNIY